MLYSAITYIAYVPFVIYLMSVGASMPPIGCSPPTRRCLSFTFYPPPNLDLYLLPAIHFLLAIRLHPLPAIQLLPTIPPKTPLTLFKSVS